MTTINDPGMVSEAELQAAVAALRDGQIVAFPTETVYGLGADASNPAAIRRLFAAKGRPADHPVIVHLAGSQALDLWASRVPDTARRLAKHFWPGPLTLILPRAAHVLDAVTGGQSTVGLRVPDHPVALALLRAFGGGLVAPSANRFGRISPTRAAHVRAELGDAVAMVLDGGPCRVGVESTIIDLSGAQPMLLRPGQLDLAAIEAVLGQPLVRPSAAVRTKTRAPGMLSSHYAPATPLQIVEPDHLVPEVSHRLEQGARVAVLARRAAPPLLAHVPWRSAPRAAAEYAQALYAELRELDALGGDQIIVEAVPEDDAWLAVRDRLRRAAQR